MLELDRLSKTNSKMAKIEEKRRKYKMLMIKSKLMKRDIYFMVQLLKKYAIHKCLLI